jgi:hypothetical protein
LKIEIASLEQKLDELQSDEYRCHSDMINQRSLELASSLPFADSSIARSEDSSNHEFSQENVDIIVNGAPPGAEQQQQWIH